MSYNVEIFLSASAIWFTFMSSRMIYTKCCEYYDRESDFGGAVLGTVLIDILHPRLVVVETVGRDADDLDIALCKVICTASNLA
jgi:hypothetical protein